MTEPDMERMARSGAERSCWRIMGILQDSEVLPRFTDGGDASAKEGWRIAVSMIYGYTKDRKRAWEIMETLGLCSEQESRVQFTMADRKINAVASTSAGRLLMPSVRYSGSGAGQDLKEASTALQFAAEAYEQQNLSNISQEQKENKDILLHETKERFVLNTQMLVKQITEAKMRGEDTGILAYRFHQVLAEMITAACIKAKESSGRDKVALSGGVFQNRLLLRLTEERLLQEGFEVLRHRMIPPNDGGIAIGQAAYGMYQLQK